MNNETIKIYSLAPFDRGAKVRWLLTELGVDFTPVLLSRDKKENETPEYLKLNPMGRVPVLSHGSNSFYESGAICSYLADRFSEKGLAPSMNSPLRGKYLQWMFFASATLDTMQAKIMIIEDIPEGELRTQKESALLSDLHDSMEALHLELKNGDYLVGGEFSAADISVGYHLFFLTLWPELNVVIEKFPNVVKYLARLKNRSAAQKTNALEYN